MLQRTSVFLAAALFLSAAHAHAADLVAGPLAGSVTPNSARVWMQFSEAGQLTITAYDVDARQEVSGVRVDIEGPSPFVCDVPIHNLQPNRTYRLEAKYDDAAVKLPPFTLRTAPTPGEEAAFSVAFGSNLEFAPNSPKVQTGIVVKPDLPPAIPMIREIAATKPRAFLLLGNTGYLPAKLEDFPTTHRAAYRFITDFHSAVRRIPDMRDFLANTPTYALFNDRDFGPADSVGTYVFAQESLVAFQKFWPNPDWGTPENPGCYNTFSLGDVDFVMLDSRTLRTSPAVVTTAPTMAARAPVMFGSAQLDWLKKKLSASHATFKVLAAPCDLFGDSLPAEVDSWSHFPEERQDFVSWLANEKITGLIAIAGNQATPRISRFKAETLTYPLCTLGVSSLYDPAGTNTFGTLDFGAEGEHRFMTLRLHDEKGKTKAEQTLFAVQLKPR